MDLDGSGEITLQEMMHVVIKNIETLEINSGDLKFEDDELLLDHDLQNVKSVDPKLVDSLDNISTIQKDNNRDISAASSDQKNLIKDNEAKNKLIKTETD
jgi:hypothetical protein